MRVRRRSVQFKQDASTGCNALLNWFACVTEGRSVAGLIWTTILFACCWNWSNRLEKSKKVSSSSSPPPPSSLYERKGGEKKRERHRSLFFSAVVTYRLLSHTYTNRCVRVCVYVHTYQCISLSKEKVDTQTHNNERTSVCSHLTEDEEEEGWHWGLDQCESPFLLVISEKDKWKGFHAYFLVIFDIDINASSLGRDFGRWRIKTSLIVIVALHQFVGTVDVRQFFIVLCSKRTERENNGFVRRRLNELLQWERLRLNIMNFVIGLIVGYFRFHRLLMFDNAWWCYSTIDVGELRVDLIILSRRDRTTLTWLIMIIIMGSCW